MDKITQNLLNTYVAAEHLQALKPDEQFEHFAAYSVLSLLCSETLDVEDVIVRGGGDAGIDALAIFVNGVLVTDVKEVDELANKNKYIDAEFVALQAKSGGNFNGGEIGTFCFGVNDFFKENPTLPVNAEVRACMEIESAVYRHSSKFKKGKPSLKMYYVTTGQWKSDAALLARIEAEKDDLKATGLFGAVEFYPVDADSLQKSYAKTQSKTAAEVIFKNKVTLPDMAGVSQAYLGILPGEEFLKLIQGSGGSILKPVFYDNVRDFQQYNDVNRGIRETLRGPRQEHFSLLNNGITVIARSLETVGDKFFLEDYQIVNGCQTSHVIHDCRTDLTKQMYVPVRLIATDDDLLINSIIEATNSQTEVKSDQLLALSSFQKKLENFYDAFTGEKRLHYERRSKQYQTNADVERVRIVTIYQQMRAFASMFLDLPHRGHYVRGLSPFIGGDLFNKNHQLEPYYTSAYAAYRLEFFFRNGSLKPKYKAGRYHLLMIARHLLAPDPLPTLMANKMVKVCDQLNQAFWDDSKALGVFEKGCELLDGVVTGSTLDRADLKVESFTNNVIDVLRKAGK